MGPSVKVWIAALLLAVIVLIAMELFWRGRGVLPSVADDEVLWAYHRAHVYGKRDQTVVLLGSSRMQVDFSTDTFRARYPDYSLVQLAVSGHAPYAALDDLSRDDAFSGLVLMAVQVAQLERRHARKAQRPYVSFYHDEWEPRDRYWLNGERLELLASSLLTRNLAMKRPELDLRHLLDQAIRGRGLPQALYSRVRFDRSRPSDYTLTNVEEIRPMFMRPLRTKAAGSRSPSNRWLGQAREMREMVARIRERGGDVVFVRFPTSPDRYALEERMNPKNRYWDELAAVSGAATIHFKELPGLQNLVLPDSSHLDLRDAPAFTEALLDELVRMGHLPEH